MRLVFLGTPEFAVPSLLALREAGHEILMTVSQPDRPRGRGQRSSPAPLRAAAMEAGLLTATLERGQRDAVYARLLELRPDAAIVVAFGHIVREPLLHGPPLGCLNLHASLLPRWRGAAPIQRAILAGDTETGACVMQLAEGLDTGPVYASEATPIAPRETLPQLHDRLAELGAKLLVRTLDRIEHEQLKPQAQRDELATYAKMLEKSEGSADFARGASHVDRRVRALNPWPGVTVLHGDRRLKLLQVESIGEALPPGRLLLASDRVPVVGCGDASLRLVKVQPEGRAAMDGAAYWRGVGAALGAELRTLPGFESQEDS